MTSIDQQSTTAAAWWRNLQPNLRNGDPNPHADRAALARLRRADLLGAMQERATFNLFRALGRTHPNQLPEVALCAAVLATVRDDDRRFHAARQLGAPPGESEDRAVMSPLRFRRLIQATSPEDRLILFRRAVALAGHAINVRDLAAACLDWSDGRRQRWIFEYYAAGNAAPHPEPTPEELPA
ncbi:MAG: type I-E CRISPR-associated protein Cse2/CasB [Acetobacteraceae bacterium]